MLKLMRRLIVVGLLFVAVNGANAGDLFGAVQPSGPASLERLSLADYRLPWLALAETPLDSISTGHTSIGVSTPRRPAAAPVAEMDARRFDKDSSVWTSGEAGVLYGQSIGGRHRFDTEQGYIFGTVGNDNIQISAGAAYERWNSRGWRGR